MICYIYEYILPQSLLFNYFKHVSPCLQIYYYANIIYGSAGVDENNIEYVTVGTGAVNVFMTIVAVGAFF